MIFPDPVHREYESKSVLNVVKIVTMFCHEKGLLE